MVSGVGVVQGKWRAGLLLAGLLLLPACSWRMPWHWHWHRTPTTGLAAVDALRHNGPVTWQAEVACPGCSERWLTLTLFPDGFFRLRERYVGRDGERSEDFHDLGRWSLAEDDESRLVLHGGSEQPRQLRLLKDGRLRLLDSEGRELMSIRDYVLPRLPRADVIAEDMRLLGFYVADGGAGLFTECLTGQVWPLARNAAGSELAARHAALSARTGPLPVLVSLSGRFQGSSPLSDQPGLLQVEQLDRFWPGERCHRGPIAAAQPLTGTAWQLIELDGQPLPLADPGVLATPVQLRLRNDGRAMGHTGCNRLQGTFVRNNEQIGFTRLVTTRMTCVPAAMQREQAVLAALRAVRQWRMVSNQLELSDGERVRARWLAVDMP